MDNKKKNLGESVRQRLKNLSKQRGRPFDELLRYYAMERFLYRLSISSYSKYFFLKGGLMFKVWDERNHRATMDIDLLARASNQVEEIRKVIQEIALSPCPEDAVSFDTSKLILHKVQAGGEYNGISCSFSAQLFTTKMPLLIDIGFNDKIIPKPQKINYPTLLGMSEPSLLGYTMETVFAEKFESIVKLAVVNTRMKDFYDLWNISRSPHLNIDVLKTAISDVFRNRGTLLEYPIAFTAAFYDDQETQKRWKNFLVIIGSDSLSLKDVISSLSNFVISQGLVTL